MGEATGERSNESSMWLWEREERSEKRADSSSYCRGWRRCDGVEEEGGRWSSMLSMDGVVDDDDGR